MKVAIVTGAHKGLGYEWCKKLAQDHFTVILTARDLQVANQAASRLKDLGLTIHPMALDVCDEKQILSLREWTERKFGRLDLLINNAGINPKDYKDKSRMEKAFYLNTLTAEEMLHVIHTNSIAPILMVKHFRDLLKVSDRPMVVQISSWLGSVNQISFGGHYGYVGSKNLLNTLNRSLAFELMSDRIICISVNPGWVQTDMGGPKATFTAAEAVSNLYHLVLEKVEINDSGKFFNYDGSIHPW